MTALLHLLSCGLACAVMLVSIMAAWKAGTAIGRSTSRHS